MTDSTHARLPAHLRRYIVKQDHSRYTPEDHAVWRFIMRQLRNYLSKHAHNAYLDGLNKSGITTDAIPRIDDIDEHLESFGWGAVPVSGFIPPAAFMEFQSLGILPIASDMRTMAHIQYTPAPDIVHEAAGHAPFLAHPEYGAYLRQYGSVARHSIISRADMDQYDAIRILSDLKEDPRSTPADISRAERRLNEVTAAITEVSEAGLLSRMNWWTAEYGLVGDLDDPKIFGAGLLSSVGESRSCLRQDVRKIPLSVDCVNFSYDITEPQPQLFVARNFAQLGEVLEDLAAKLAFRLGGRLGCERARAAATVNTVQLDSGVQISGQLVDFAAAGDGAPVFLKFSGPCQISRGYRELAGHGSNRHPSGFSSPLGTLRGRAVNLGDLSPADLPRLGLEKGRMGSLSFESGFTVRGDLLNWVTQDDRILLLTFANCTVSQGSHVHFDPSWGEFDLAVGSRVASVFGGPADRTHYGQTEDFAARLVPRRDYAQEERARHDFFSRIRRLRDSAPFAPRALEDLIREFLSAARSEWLLGVELLELAQGSGVDRALREDLSRKLEPGSYPDPGDRQCVADGVALAEKRR